MAVTLLRTNYGLEEVETMQNKRGGQPATPQSGASYELMEIQAAAREANANLAVGGEVAEHRARQLIRTIAPAVCRAQHYLNEPTAA